MKGIVFTEFLDLVETQFGLDTVDEILGKCPDLPSGGIYTAVGTYDYTELLSLVSELGKTVHLPVPALVNAFGQHLFRKFKVAYPPIFERMRSASELLSLVEGFIHVEVRKLYPDASLPSLDYRVIDDKHAELHYKSDRPFADLAVGLIQACGEHFGETIGIERHDVADSHGKAARFDLTLSTVIPCQTT